MENKYGFAVLGGGKEGNTQKSPGSQGLPLLPPEGDVAHKKRPVDYIVCVLVVIFMVASAQISSILQVKYHFNNPAFIIWFSTSWLILCFPLQIIYYYNILKRKGSIVEILGGMDIVKRNMKWAPIFTVYWYLANYLFVWGIAYTNVPSSLTIEQLATVFVFVLSVIFLKEEATIGKIFSVLVCIGGVVVVAFSDKSGMHNGRQPLKGDLLIVGSGCATAMYMVTYKRVVGHNTDVASVNSLLGFIGICNCFFLWPVFTLLHFLEAEPLHPNTWPAWALLVGGALLSFIFNYLLNLGIFFTSPLFFRVAQICSIPASFVLGLLLGDKFLWMQMLGALVVIAGFSLFSYFSHAR
jgi:drug/metabolite transporter (DMT)-like permease